MKNLSFITNTFYITNKPLYIKKSATQSQNEKKKTNHNARSNIQMSTVTSLDYLHQTAVIHIIITFVKNHKIIHFHETIVIRN